MAKWQSHKDTQRLKPRWHLHDEQLVSHGVQLQGVADDGDLVEGLGHLAFHQHRQLLVRAVEPLQLWPHRLVERLLELGADGHALGD